MSLLDALKVALAAQEIRPLVAQDAAEPSAADGASSVLTPTKEAAGSSGSQAEKKSIIDNVDDDLEIRKLDEALQYRPSSVSLTSKGVAPNPAPKPLVRKRKNETVHIRSSNPLPMPRSKKNKKGSSFSEGGCIGSTKPTPAFSGGFLPSNKVESMETEIPETTSKEKGKAHDEPKMVTFSGMALSSSLGPDHFIGEEEDQVSSLPSSWFGPELMSFFRYADVDSKDMEIDPAMAEDKFIPDWDIRNKDSVMDELIARTLLVNISTPLDHSRSRRMKSQDLGAAILTNQAQSNVFVTEVYRRWVEAESVRENLEKEIRSLKRKAQRTPEIEKKVAQLTSDVQAQQEKIKSLTTQNQSSQAAAASAAEDRDRVAAELKKFSESMQEKDREHKLVMAKMEESFNNARLAYAKLVAAGFAKNRGSRS
ncbi:putative transcription factor bZIP family [Helianthus annuus]|nr:putative transcription factor bZIP family [Helianthus annuus]